MLTSRSFEFAYEKNAAPLLSTFSYISCFTSESETNEEKHAV